MARHCHISLRLLSWITVAIIFAATGKTLTAQSLAASAAQTGASPSSFQTGSRSAATTAATESAVNQGSAGSDIAKTLTPTPATFVVAPAIAVAGAPWNVAAADLNGDGKTDLLVLNSTAGKLSVMLGKGDGTFGAPVEYAVGLQPASLVTGDFNGDGKLDVAVVNTGDGTVSLLLGNGDGTLQVRTTYTGIAGAKSIAVVDLNGDGKLDLAIASASAQSLGILLNHGDGTFATAIPFDLGASPNALAIGDFDGDGNQDVATANANGTISLMLGRGDGSFRSLAIVPVGTASLSSITAGDFNSDGKTDLAVTQSGTKLVTVLLGTGNGSFNSGKSYSAGNNPAQIIVADINGDKIPDLITANQAANTFSVLLGTGDGSFQHSIDFAAGKSPQAIVAADFDGDGKIDLALANFGDQSVGVPLGNGDGTFKAARVYGAELARKAIAVGDLDGDGKPDLVVTNFCGADAACAGNGTVSVLLANADGSYRAAGSYPLGVGPVSAALVDLNGDKKLDLIAINKGDKTITVLLGNGDGTFQSALMHSLQDSPEALAVGDFNGDGHIDLAVAGDCGSKACARPGELTLMLGAGDGSFVTGESYSVGYGPVSVAAGDINGDGVPDLVVANACGDDSSCKSKGTATVLLGNGQGAFQPGPKLTLGMSPSSVALGDLAGRKVLDLAVAYRGDNKVALLSGNGDGSFKTSVTYAAGTAPSSVVIADFNGDSKADVAVANFKDATVSVLLGKGDGTLQAAVAYPVGAGPESLVAVQAAQSSPVDLVAANGNSGSTPMGSDVTVLKNVVAVGFPDTVEIALTSGTDPSNYGDSLTFTTTVTGDGTHGAPAGTVDFMDNSSPITGCQGVQLMRVDDNDSSADCTSSNGNQNLLNAGDHMLVGSYTSTNGYQNGDSNSLDQMVKTANTTTMDSGNPNPSTFGAPVDITAVVTGPGSVPTGTVTFFDTSNNNNPLCTDVPLDKTGKADCPNISNLTLGNHVIEAKYSGDSNYNTSNGQYTQTVNKADTSTTDQGNPNPSSYGSPVDITAKVTGAGGVPTGTVTFIDTSDNNTVLCNMAPLDKTGMADCPNIQNLTAGNHVIEADYSGDSNYNKSSGTYTQMVNKANTTTADAGNPNPSIYGSAVDITAMVTGTLTIPTGTVTFIDTSNNNTVLCKMAPLDKTGKADCPNIQNLTAGNHVIEADYSGDGNYNKSSGTYTQVVNMANTTTTDSGNPNPSIFGSPVDITAMLTGTLTIPTGTVTFIDTSNNNAVLCNMAPLDKTGKADCPNIKNLTAGNHVIEADYSGDSNYNKSSGTYTQVVNAADTKTADAGNPNPSIYGSAVDITATVTGTSLSVPTGTVTFIDTSNNNAVLCNMAALDKTGKADCPNIASLTGGNHVIEADYSGDSNYNKSSGTYTQIVNRATPTTAITSSLNPSIQGQPVTFTTSVTGVPGGLAPTGSVTFTGGGISGCSGIALDNTGHAACTPAQLASGADVIVGTYSGDNNYTSAAPSLTQDVQDFSVAGTWNSSPLPVDIIQAFNNTNNPYSSQQQPITFTAMPLNMLPFSAPLQLTCMVMPLQGQSAQNAPTCALSPTMFPAGGGSTAVVVSAAASTTLGAYNVVVVASDTADNSGLSHSTIVPVNVGALTTTQSVTSTVPANLSVAFVGTMASSVTFSCASITGPDGKTQTPCANNTYNVNVNVPGGPVTLSTDPNNPTTLAITIAASTQMTRLMAPQQFLAMFCMGMPAMVLLGSLPFGKTSRRRLWQWLGMMLILMSLLQIVACGGGSFNRSNLNTPPGNYTILIEGTNGSGVQTTAVVPFTVFGG